LLMRLFFRSLCLGVCPCILILQGSNKTMEPCLVSSC
jgi:hypothetical protein